MKKVAVVGVGETKFSGPQDKTEVELFAEAAMEAITESNLKPEDIKSGMLVRVHQKIKETNTAAGSIKDSNPCLAALPLRIKSRENNALVYKRIMPFAPNNRINQSGQGKLFLWHDELNRYGLYWDAGQELNAKTIRLILDDSFTEYNVPLVLKTAQNNIIMINNAGSDKARGTFARFA